MSEIQYTTVKRLARHIQQMKAEGKSTILLLGAGVSGSAGIPLAGEMVENLKKDENYSYQFEGLKKNENESEYNSLMKELTPKQRQEYIRGYIDKAKINLAHLYIGSLIKEGYVKSVLTTNFDPLLVKTMALFNTHIYVYDLANARNYVSDSIMSPNVFYLHGQGHAFLMLNTERELEEPKAYFKTLINDLMKDHCFLVVGYSGMCDFIFEELCAPRSFSNGLMWVGYKSEHPPIHVSEKLCSKESVKYTNSNGADSFFRDLVNELGINTMPFIDSPFQHLKDTLQNIGGLKYDDGKEVRKFDLLEQPNTKIDAAIDLVEKGEAKHFKEEFEKVKKGELIAQLQLWELQNKYDEIIEREKQIIELNIQKASNILAWAYSIRASQLADLAKEKDNDEDLFLESFDKYQKAVNVNPQAYEYWYNWGVDMLDFGKSKGNDKEVLLGSIEKFKKAIEKNANMNEAWCNWGVALGVLAFIEKSNKEELWLEAFKKYERTIEINPNSFEGWMGWASDMGNFANEKKAEELFQKAFIMYDKAIAIKNDQSDAWNNWGTDLVRLAELKNNDERLLLIACAKYKKGVAVKPERYEVWYNWGVALNKLSENVINEPHLLQAIEKFKQVIKINPDFVEAWNSWSNSLILLYNHTKDETYLTEAFRVLSIYKDPKHADYNLACAYALNMQVEEAYQCLEECLKNKLISDRNHIETDGDLTSLKETSKFKLLLDKYLPVE